MKKYTAILATLLVGAVSCNPLDILNTKPEATLDKETFFKQEDNLRMYSDAFYGVYNDIDEFYEQQTWNFSRIPVYDNSKDYIIGYVLKDMVLKELSEDKFDPRLSDLMRPILSFCEDDSVYQIWEKMLEKREHISIILDEYGCLRGVVSMEDIIETMTGVEIVDEDDVAVDMQAFAKEKSRRRFNASTCFGTHSGI